MLVDQLGTAIETTGIDEVLAFSSLREFCGFASRIPTRGGGYRETWHPTPHLDLIIDRLEEIDRGDFQRKGLLISLPPRHGKSTLGSQLFPAWSIIRAPWKRVIVTSYSAQLSIRFSRRVRDIVDSVGSAIGDVRTKHDSKGAQDWETTEEGGMLAAGVKGPITGRGGDVIIFDDVIKNAQEALSKNSRDALWEWWLSTVQNRVEPGGKFIGIMTRWHEDDLFGRLLKNEPDHWEAIRIPAIHDEEDFDDPLGRELGEPLWPERYDLDFYNDLRARHDHDEAQLGDFWWDSIYQGNPSPRQGAIFKRDKLRFFDEQDGIYRLNGTGRSALVGDLGIFLTMDLAISKKETADFTVVAVCSVTGDGDLLVHDIVRDRLDGAEQLDLLRSLNHQYDPFSIEIEAVQYQSSLVDHAVRDGLPARPVKAEKDKVSRATFLSNMIGAQKVFFRKGAPYLSTLVDELIAFPRGAHDDQMDAIAIGALHASRGAGIVRLS